VRVNRFDDHARGRPYHAALVDLRGARTPHGHRDFYEVMAVLDGAGSQDLGTGPQPLRPGDLVLIRPGDRHALAGTDPGGVRFFNVAFPAAAWRAFVDLSGVGAGWDGFATPPAGRAEAAAVEACRRLLDRFHDTPRMVDLIRFWLDVLPALHPEPDAIESSGAPRWLATACAAMRQPDHLRAGVPRLLRLAHVSPAHLARSMRRYYGTTPTEFVAQLRLRQAAALLATTSRSITEIGDVCGYASASYFNRCFRAAHGMSPREFRRTAREAFVPP
jgi:AraC-like DNA-binding protein/mannose-6-phosphate isomerase-like protein (cupin superfamily)